MSLFETEFPVRKSITLLEFEDLVIEWISGIQNSTLKDRLGEIRSDFEDWQASKERETILFKKIITDEEFYAGVRHEILDDLGRIWRTEVTISHTKSSASARIHAQCMAKDPNSRVATPRRPYIAKLMLRDAWASDDAGLEISDIPIYFNDSQTDAVSEYVTGQRSTLLPIVYVSRDDDNRLALDVEKLAYDLGGVAHILVEPSRAASFQMMALTKDRNPYGGTIGVGVRGRGIVRRFYIGSNLRDDRELANAISDLAIQIRSSQKSETSVGWLDIQELQTKRARISLENEANKKVKEYVETFDNEIAQYKEKVEQLEADLMALRARAEADQNDVRDAANIVLSAISELYPGEIRDRVRLGIKLLLDIDTLEIDSRTLAVLGLVLEKVPFTGGAKALISQIKSAGKDASEMPARLGAILSSLGYTPRSDGKHTNYLPPPELPGLVQETLPKTPSDWRAGPNMAGQLVKSLGLRDLS